MSLWVIPWNLFYTELVKLVTSESDPILIHLNIIPSRINGFLSLSLKIASSISAFNKKIFEILCLCIVVLFLQQLFVVCL